MADILIRGMEKPGSCRECDFCEVQDINFEILYFCNRNDRFLDDEEACNIPNDCPIIELPEHGDLVDLDERVTKQVYDDYRMEWDMKTKTVRQWLNIDVADMPVVIPSNKEV